MCIEGINTAKFHNEMILLCAISSDVHIVRHRHRIINDNTWVRKSATMCSVSRDIDSYFRSSIIYPTRTFLVRRIHECRRSVIIYEHYSLHVEVFCYV